MMKRILMRYGLAVRSSHQVAYLKPFVVRCIGEGINIPLDRERLR